MRYPRVVAWSSNKKFYRHMLRDFLHGRVHAKRLIPDEIEAGSGWWVSSRAYFDGRVSEVERIPRHLNRQNHYEVPSEFYREFQEQRSGLDQMMKHSQNIFEKMNKFMEDMSVGTGANKELIIVDQHYEISDLSGFQSTQGGPSSFQTSANNSFFTMGTPTNWQTPMPSQPGSSNWQSQMPSYTPTPNWQSPIPSHPGDAGLCDPSLYTHLPPTTVLSKKRVDKTKKKCKNDNVSPLNLGNAFAYDNVGGDDVVITCVHDTGIYFTYENVDPNKVPHTYDEIKSMVEKQIQEDRGRQLAIMNLGHQFDNVITTKDELRKGYEECRDIPLVQRALIEKFLKIESELDQQMQNALFRKAAKLEKQIRDKNKWLQQL
ncbi:hypothetical protein Tco_0672657 [Tanacetum coccineum]